MTCNTHEGDPMALTNSRRTNGVLAPTIVALAMAGLSVSAWAHRTEATEKNDRIRDVTRHSGPLKATGKVYVSNILGNISVDAWDREEVRVEIIKTARS